LAITHYQLITDCESTTDIATVQLLLGINGFVIEQLYKGAW